MHDFKLLIGGQRVAGDMTMEVINPATERVIALAPRASHAQLDAAVAAAKAAFSTWSRTDIAVRRAALLAMADILEQNLEELARLTTLETGKPLADSRAEIGGAAYFTRYFAALDLAPQPMDPGDGRLVEIQRRPLGVIGAIVAWNYPLIMVGFKLPPALLAGNTVVLKPAPTAPLTTLRFAELFGAKLPPGVLNVIVDANDLGEAMTSHPDIRKITFTGSTGTGKKIMASAAPTLKRLTLELGGNDAAIVMGDVDPQDVAPKLFDAAFVASGQVCLALKRLYVHESIYEEMCELLVELANGASVGDGLEQGVTIGPLQNRMQFDRVKGLLEVAERDGRVIAGGVAGVAEAGEGFFVRPTIVRDITDGSPLVDEEQFGPILPVISFSDPEDALARANASPYGLGGSIWSSDLRVARDFASRLDAGTVWINAHLGNAPNVPFGGSKQSGIGVEFGEAGLAEFTQAHAIYSPAEPTA